MSDELRPVFTANGQIDAQQVKAFLEASGVRCMLRGESLSKTHAFCVDGLGRVDVLVSADDEGRASELLASADRGVLRLPDDAEVS